MNLHSEKIDSIVSALKKTEEGNYDYFNKTSRRAPSRKEVISIIKNMQSLMFPSYFSLSDNEGKDSAQILNEVFLKLKEQISLSVAFSKTGCNEDDAERLSYEII